MSSSFLQKREDTSGLYNVVKTRIIPFDVGSMLLLEDGDGLPTINKLPFLSLRIAVEFFMGGIIHEDDIV